MDELVSNILRMNTDIIEAIAKHMSNTGVVNMACAGKDIHESLDALLKKRRLGQFEDAVVSKLKRLNDVRMFVNRAIADGTQHYDGFMSSYLMNNVFNRFIGHVYPDWVEGNTFDREPEDGKVMHLMTSVGDFTLEVTFSGGFTGSYGGQPWYNWLGIAITGISVYTADDMLMRWYQKLDTITETQSHNYDSDEDITIFQAEREIKDVFVKFDKFRMTPDMSSKVDIKKTEEDFEDYDDYYEAFYDDVYYEAGEHCLTSYLQDADNIILKPDHPRFDYAHIFRNSIIKTFAEPPTDVIERLVYVGDIAISMHLNRLQSWSPSYIEGFVHGRDEPEWNEKSIDQFSPLVIERLTRALPEWKYNIGRGCFDKCIEFKSNIGSVDVIFVVSWMYGSMYWFMFFADEMFSLDISSRNRTYHITLSSDDKPTKKNLEDKAIVENALKNAGFSKSKKSLDDTKCYFDSWDEYKHIFAWMGYSTDDSEDEEEYSDGDDWDSDDYDPENCCDDETA